MTDYLCLSSGNIPVIRTTVKYEYDIVYDRFVLLPFVGDPIRHINVIHCRGKAIFVSKGPAVHWAAENLTRSKITPLEKARFNLKNELELVGKDQEIIEVFLILRLEL